MTAPQIRAKLYNWGDRMNDCLGDGVTISIFKNEIGRRIGNLAIGIIMLPIHCFDTLRGVFFAFGAPFKPIFYEKYLYSILGSRVIVTCTFESIVKTINPDAQFSAKVYNLPLTNYFDNFFKDLGKTARSSNNPFKAHFISRMAYSLAPLVATITRTSEAIFGLVAATISIITLGKYEKCNMLAMRGLLISALIEDYSFSMIKTINPWSACPSYPVRDKNLRLTPEGRRELLRLQGFPV